MSCLTPLAYQACSHTATLTLLDYDPMFGWRAHFSNEQQISHLTTVQIPYHCHIPHLQGSNCAAFGWYSTNLTRLLSIVASLKVRCWSLNFFSCQQMNHSTKMHSIYNISIHERQALNICPLIASIGMCSNV